MDINEKKLEQCKECDGFHDLGDAYHNDEEPLESALGNLIDNDAWFQKMADFIIEHCQIKFTYNKSGDATNAIMTKAHFDELLNMHFRLMKSKMILDALTNTNKETDNETDEELEDRPQSFVPNSSTSNQVSP